MTNNSERGRLLITGAAGFLGRHTVAEALNQGYQVRATDLPGMDLSWAQEAGAEVAYGDLTVRDQVCPLLEGMELVAHLAAVHNLSWSRERLLAINQTSAALMAEESAAAGVAHFVYCSSADTYGSYEGVAVREEFEQRPQNNYAYSKLAAERSVVEIAAKRSLPVTTLRPTIIYGPWCTYAAGMFCAVPLIVHRHLGKLPRMTGGPLLNNLHVEDAAGAVVHALSRLEMAGQFYNVADDHVQTTGEYFNNFVEPLDVEWSPLNISMSTRSLALSTRLMELLPVAAFELLSKLLQAEWGKIVEAHDLVDALKPTFDKGFVTYGSGDHVIDNTKLKDAGYELRWPRFDDGYRQTIQWYQDQRWIPKSARTS